MSDSRNRLRRAVSKVTPRRIAAALLATAAVCLGWHFSARAEEPVRRDEMPRGRFQPSPSYLERFSHANPQLQLRPAPTPAQTAAPVSPIALLDRQWQLQAKKREEATMRAETEYGTPGETEYAPRPANARPTPLFSLPGER